MRKFIDALLTRNSISEEGLEPFIHSNMHALIVLYTVTLAVSICWLISFCVCCFPSRLRRYLGGLAGILIVVCVVAQLILTDNIEQALKTTEKDYKRVQKLIAVVNSMDDD